jgi:hypothetical protein
MAEYVKFNKHLEKSQGVRAFDVAVLGPFLVWVGARRELGDLERFLLVAAGLGTIAYNFRNFGRIASATGQIGRVESDQVSGEHTR